MTNKFCHFFIFLIAVLTTSSNAAVIPMPDGLCVVKVLDDNKKETMGGHGFLIDDFFVTSAHIVYNQITSILCAQSGRMLEILDDRTDDFGIHDLYEFNSSPLSSSVDVAYIKLKRRFVSKFRFPNQPSLSTNLLDNGLNFGVIKIRDTENFIRAPHPTVDFHELTPDLLGVSVVATEGDFTTNLLVRAPDLYMSNDPDRIVLKVRDSGSPLCGQMPSGHYLVIGITSAGAPGETLDGRTIRSNFFTPIGKVANWLSERGAPFSGPTFKKPDCLGDLH